MQGLEHKLYIPYRTENQRNVGLNVGFVYSLQSFLFPLLFTYSVESRTAFFKNAVLGWHRSRPPIFIPAAKTKIWSVSPFRPIRQTVAWTRFARIQATVVFDSSVFYSPCCTSRTFRKRSEAKMKLLSFSLSELITSSFVPSQAA